MKYRAKKGKIKYEHSMIKGLRAFLESLQSNLNIDSMIPGEIKPVKEFQKLVIRRLMPTQTGLKAIFHSGGAVQDVFFVGKKEALYEILSPYLLPKP